MFRGLVHKAGNRGHLPGKLCRQAGGRSDRPEHSVYFRLPFYSHHSRLIPFFLPGYPSYPSHSVRDRFFFDLVARLEQVEEDCLVHAFLAKFEVVPVNRRFSTIFRRDIEPGASGGQNVQDAVDQPAGSQRGRPMCGFVWGRYF